MAPNHSMELRMITTNVFRSYILSMIQLEIFETMYIKMALSKEVRSDIKMSFGRAF